MHDIGYADGVPIYSAYYEEFDPDEVEVLPEITMGIYARISDADDRLGVDRQLEIAARSALLNPMLMASKRNAVVVQQYVDNNITAYDVKKERPGFRAMVNDLRDGIINTVWGVDFDRIARDPEEAEMLRGVMSRNGGQMILTDTPGDNYDIVSGEGRMQWRMKTMLAAEEVENTKKRQKRQRRQKVQKGGFNGGKRRYGYVPDMSVIIESEAAIIREVAQRMLDLESVTSIAKDLNTRGVPTALRDFVKKDPTTGEESHPYANSIWRATNLQRAVTGPHVAGFRLAYGAIARQRAEWPPILDEQMWHRLQVLINNPLRKASGHKTGGRVSPLSGLLVCGKCGAKLRIQKLSQVKRPGDERRYWQCNSPLGCHGVNRSDTKLSGWIIDEILAAFDNTQFMQRRLMATDTAKAEDREDVFEQLQDSRAALGELQRDYYTRKMKIDRELFESLVAEHERDITRYESTLRQLAARQEVDIELLLSGQLAEEWETLSIEKQHKLLGFVCSSVMVLPVAGGGRWINDPLRHYEINWLDEGPRHAEGPENQLLAQ